MSMPQRSQQGPPRGGWINRGGMRRGRGRGGTGGFNRQGGTGQQPIGTGGKPKNALKFESDFDFESANEEFDKVRNELAKTKIGKNTHCKFRFHSFTMKTVKLHIINWCLG